MSETIERAIAAVKACPTFCVIAEGAGMPAAFFDQAAREVAMAVIEAMREPPEEVCDAAARGAG